jgi:hypothetical protein
MSARAQPDKMVHLLCRRHHRQRQHLPGNQLVSEARGGWGHTFDSLHNDERESIQMRVRWRVQYKLPYNRVSLVMMVTSTTALEGEKNRLFSKSCCQSYGMGFID